MTQKSQKPWFDEYSKIHRRYQKHDDILKEKWYHTFTFPDGRQVKGTYDHSSTIDLYFTGLDLKGQTLLDIGCADGYFLIEAEKREAIVTGVDASPFYINHAQFASKQFGMKPSIIECDIFGDEFQNLGTFDVIMCNHVLCHINDKQYSKAMALDVIKDHMTEKSVLIIVDNFAKETIDLLKKRFKITISDVVMINESKKCVCVIKS